MSVLSGRGLRLVYPGGVTALDGVDLDLHEAELLSVIGPNGSGKSTLLRALSGLLPPTAGEVRLRGRDLRACGPRERARDIAVVPQSLPAVPEIEVERFVLGGRYARMRRWHGPQSADREAVHAALSTAEVADLRTRRLDELSGGQRQRVVLARALAQQAGVLAVDEPTAALDLGHGVKTFGHLAALAHAGHAVLVVTHDVNLAAQHADRVALLCRGKLVAVGTPREVLVPEVLVPVYGRDLHFGRLPGQDGVPFVLPRKRGA